MANWTFTKQVALQGQTVSAVYVCTSDDVPSRVQTIGPYSFQGYVDGDGTNHPTDLDIDTQGFNYCTELSASDDAATAALTAASAAFAALATTSGPPTTTPITSTLLTPTQQAANTAAIEQSQATQNFNLIAYNLQQLQVLVDSGAIQNTDPDYVAAVAAATDAKTTLSTATASLTSATAALNATLTAQPGNPGQPAPKLGS